MRAALSPGARGASRQKPSGVTEGSSADRVSDASSATWPPASRIRLNAMPARNAKRRMAAASTAENRAARAGASIFVRTPRITRSTKPGEGAGAATARSGRRWSTASARTALWHRAHPHGGAAHRERGRHLAHRAPLRLERKDDAAVDRRKAGESLLEQVPRLLAALLAGRRGAGRDLRERFFGAAPPDHVERASPRDPREPRLERAAILVLRERPEDLPERFLRGVLGERRVPRHRVGHAHGQRGMPPHEQPERVVLAGAGARDEDGVRGGSVRH